MKGVFFFLSCLKGWNIDYLKTIVTPIVNINLVEHLLILPVVFFKVANSTFMSVLILKIIDSLVKIINQFRGYYQDIFHYINIYVVFFFLIERLLKKGEDNWMENIIFPYIVYKTICPFAIFQQVKIWLKSWIKYSLWHYHIYHLWIRFFFI